MGPYNVSGHACLDSMSRRRIPFPASYRPPGFWRKGVVRHEADVSTPESKTREQARLSRADEEPGRPQDLGTPPSPWAQAAHCESGLEVGASWRAPGQTIDRPKTNAFRERGEFVSGVKSGRFCMKVRGPDLPISTYSRYPRRTGNRDSGRLCLATVEGSWPGTSFGDVFERSVVPRSFLAWGSGGAAWTCWSEVAPRRTMRDSASCGPSYSD